MSIKIGSARHDENGTYTGGAAGDQLQTSGTNDTAGEVSMQDMYVHSKGWYALRAKSVSIANKIAELMKTACNNVNIGYDQGNRLGIITYGIDTAIKTECDCSSLVREIVKEATGEDPGNFTTENEATMLAATGYFEDKFSYTSQSSTPLYNGDILVTKTKGHTVAVVSGNARSESSGSLAVGDVVTFTGTKHYGSANASSGSTCKGGTAKITAVSSGAKHPYHLIHTGSGCTVYGWVDESDISETGSSDTTYAVGDKVKVTGKIYANGNGGNAITKAGATMYVISLVDSSKYKYYIGLSATKGGTRQGWAEPSILTKV